MQCCTAIYRPAVDKKYYLLRGVETQSRRSILVCRRALVDTSVQADAKLEVVSILKQSTTSFYANNAELEAAVQKITVSPTPNGAEKTLSLGQGRWEVFSAPHIARLSDTLGTKFAPIRYALSGAKLISNVKFSSSLFQEGWLSASGTLVAKDADTVQVNFDRFWVDLGATNLREDLSEGEASRLPDQLVSFFGRLGFFPQLSMFPVLYVDSELAVFSFPPLSSTIAVHKLDSC